VLVGALVVLIALAVVQLALALHVRNTLMASAAEGARHAAAADRSLEEGAARAALLISSSLGGYAAAVEADELVAGGLTLVEVRATSPVPLIGLWGPGQMSVAARAIEETSRG
jgi:hypothetical protein